MIDFLTKNYPGSLPRYRGEIQTGNGSGHLLENPLERADDPRLRDPGLTGGTDHDGQHVPTPAEPTEPIRR